MGGSKTVVQNVEAPPAPTATESTQAWADAMPQVYDTQMEYAPKQAEQQIQLAEQYAQRYGDAYKTSQEAMYPEVTAIQNQLYDKASQGMSEEVPQWQQDKYRSDMNANIGTNAGSGIGADYVSTGMMAQQQSRNQYYENMGLSMAGRQPIAQAQTPTTGQYMQQFTPNAVMGADSQNYGAFAQASRPFANYDKGGLNLGILGTWGGGT